MKSPFTFALFPQLHHCIHEVGNPRAKSALWCSGYFCLPLRLASLSLYLVWACVGVIFLDTKLKWRHYF